jgi:HAD superfamily hydrolase (TIGR01549 family)
MARGQKANPMKKNFGIIFDCDGTLVDSLGQAMASFNYALDRMHEEPRTEQEIKKFFGSAADRIFFGLLGNEDKALRAFEFYKEHQTELSRTMKLHVGVQDLLNTLHSNEVPMSVVTGRHEQDLAIVLAPHKISEYFVTLVTDNQLPHSKPAPDGILMAAARMKLNPENTFYVGDSAIDMEAAHAAGAQAVAAMWDKLVIPDMMKAQKPQFFAQHPMDVWTHFLGFDERA